MKKLLMMLVVLSSIQILADGNEKLDIRDANLPTKSTTQSEFSSNDGVGKEDVNVNNGKSKPVVTISNDTVNVKDGNSNNTVENNVSNVNVTMSGKYVKKDLSSFDEGLKKKLVNDGVKSIENKFNKSSVDTDYLLKRRASIQKGLSVKDMSLTDKKLISGKRDALSKVSTKFDYYNDSIYEIFTTPDFITTIKLNPDEKIVHIAGGDTNSFNIEYVVGGEGNSTYLYIMPIDVDLVTNISIVTSKRVYFFNVYSTDTIFNSYVRFNYPLELNTISYKLNEVSAAKVDSELKAKEYSKSNENVNSEGYSVIRVNSLDDLDFDYQISKGDYPFKPTKVYSDLKQTVIEMKDTLVESPVLFILNKSGDYEVVNYKQDGNRLLVDRKIMDAVLKLGKDSIYIKHK